MSGRTLYYAPPRSLRAPFRKAPSVPVNCQQFDEDVIVDVLRRNGWTVVPTSQVHRVAAGEGVPRYMPYRDEPALLEYAGKSVRAHCAHHTIEHIPARTFQPPAYRGYSIVFATAQVIAPSDSEMEGWTVDDAVRWVPALENLRR